MWRQISSYSKYKGTDVRDSEEASARNSCETHRASAWQETAHFWQHDMTQKNIRKNTQVHFSSSSSPSNDYIERLENLDTVIGKTVPIARNLDQYEDYLRY